VHSHEGLRWIGGASIAPCWLMVRARVTGSLREWAGYRYIEFQPGVWLGELEVSREVPRNSEDLNQLLDDPHGKGNEQLYEPVQLGMLRDQCPVQPAGFVVPTVGVVKFVLVPHRG
jgi:hypothetical protein